MRFGTPAVELAAINPREGTWLGRHDGQGNFPDVIFDHGPVRRGQGYDGYRPALDVLLELDRFVSGHKHVESLSFGGSEKFPVLEPRPAHVADRQWGEIGQRQPKSMRQIFVEQDFQSTGCNLGFSAKAISACIWSLGTEG